MFRQPNSTMTAVEVASSTYDGPVPADVMMQARAEDAAFRSDPQAVVVQAALAGIMWNTIRAQECIERIRDAERVGDIFSASSERKQVLPAHLKARRQYQRELTSLIASAP